MSPVTESLCLVTNPRGSTVWLYSNVVDAPVELVTVAGCPYRSYSVRVHPPAEPVY
ncbi:hypothetical protein L1785_22350 [Antribacter sp. KLBMP9083]|uniref:Uncharacterized protein n=1 Tax=Antribacter soli TaxID=2910976 RepID=A0AA41U9M7_9MICO|nr:hypothetical protein [Antribacter soli]MCF4123705.1 hypothetical protein [Antribacter soli]